LRFAAVFFDWLTITTALHDISVDTPNAQKHHAKLKAD